MDNSPKCKVSGSENTVLDAFETVGARIGLTLGYFCESTIQRLKIPIVGGNDPEREVDVFVRPSAVAKELGCSPETVKNWARTGQIPAKRDRIGWLVSRVECLEKKGNE